MNLKTQTQRRNAEWMQRWNRVHMQNYAPAPVAFARGQGASLWDVEGKEYLDMAAGVAVCSTGHAHPKVVKAIAEQAGTLGHTSNLYLIPKQIELAERLTQLSGLNRAFFCNSGTEAIEAAMKLARYWGRPNGSRTQFVSTAHGFHGRTLGALTLTRNPKYQDGFAPLLPGVTEVPFGDAEALKGAVTSQTCAVVVEPIQGEGGVHLPPRGYLKAVRDVCTDRGALMVLDEVQTGIGRTGAWFAFQHERILPDIVALAKGLGSGFPIGAILSTEDAAAFKPGSHGSTFGGNPLACAAALATLDVLETERVLPNVATQGKRLLEGLRKLPAQRVRAPRGQGLLAGFDLVDREAKGFAQKLLAAGLLVSNIGEHTIRLAPPLIVSGSEIDEALKRLASAA